MLIHQIVLGKKVPRFNQECLSSWHRLKDRDFTIVTWTDRRVPEYLAQCPVETRMLYQTSRNYGEASDILRMAIAHSHGGLYVDWDVLLVNPERFLEVLGDVSSSSCTLIQDRLTKEPNYSSVYDNSLFYMRKGNPLALHFLSAMKQNYTMDPLPQTPYLTGPLALTAFLESHEEYKDACRLIDMVDIYAFDYEEVIRQTKDHMHREVLKGHWSPKGAPAIHFWMHTWAPQRTWRERVLHKAARILRMAPGLR